MTTDAKLLRLTVHKKLTDWKNEPSLYDLKDDWEAARADHDAQIAKVQEWLDLLNVEGSAKPPNIPGRSQVQPRMVRKTAEWRNSALTETFLSTDKTFSIEPATFEDEEAAQQNELVLNYQFRNKINEVKFIDEYVRAATGTGTAFVRVGWNRETELVKVMAPTWEYLPIQTEDEMAAFQQALELKQANPRGFNEGVDPALQEAVEYFEETGTPTIARLVGEEEVDEERVIANEPTLQVLNLQNVYFDPSCEGDLRKALFVVVSFETNKAALLKEGDRYKNLDAVNWESSSPLTDPDHATETPQDFAFRDAARKKVVAYEYWGYYDIDGTGKLKPIVATWIGNVMIRMEENPFPGGFLPFVAVPYMPVQGRVYGEPDAELLGENQKILGAVYRGIIDLLGRSANGQQGIAKGMLDSVNKRKFLEGRDYEFNPPQHPNTGFIEHTFSDIPSSALDVIGLQNQEAEALTGVKAFSGGLSGESYGKVATAIRGMIDAATKREMAILRRLAAGLVEIGNKIIAMNAVFLSEEEVIRVTNRQYVTIRREDLAGNFDLKVDIATFEVDNEKAENLGFMLQTLGPNMDQGLYMMILAQIADLKRMPALAEQLRTWQPQPDPIAERLRELELMRQQKEIEKLESEIALNQAKAQAASVDADFKDLQRVEQELGVTHARKMIEGRAQAQGNQDLEMVKEAIKSRKPDEQAGDLEAGLGLAVTLDEYRNQSTLGE